jgi:hypothetical protein
MQGQSDTVCLILNVVINWWTLVAAIVRWDCYLKISQMSMIWC